MLQAVDGLLLVNRHGGKCAAVQYRSFETAHKDDHVVAAEEVDEQFAGEAPAIAAPSLKGKGTVAEMGQP